MSDWEIVNEPSSSDWEIKTDSPESSSPIVNQNKTLGHSPTNLFELFPHEKGQGEELKLNPKEDIKNALHFASYFGPGMALKGVHSIPAVYKAMKPIFEGLKKRPILNALARAGKTGAEVGAVESVWNPEDRLGAAEKGFGLGAGLGLAGEAIGAGINALRPSKLLRGNLSPEELASNVESARGTETSLGNIIQNPLMKKFYESQLSNLPFSGASGQLARTASHITEKGNEFLDKFAPKINIEEIPKKLHSDLINAAREQEKAKSFLYKDFDELADKHNLKIDISGFNKTAKKYKDALQEMQLLKFEPEVNNLLNKLTGYEKKLPEKTSVILDKSGKPISKGVIYPSAKEINILASKLRSLSNQYGKSPESLDRASAKVLGDLSKSLKNNLKTSVEKSGDEKLIKSFNRAEQNYKNNFSQFLDKDVMSFTKNPNVDEELLLSKFFKAGKNDRSNQLKKLMDKLPDESKDLVRKHFISQALEGKEGYEQINPNKLMQLWKNKNLGPRMKKVLFPNKLDRKALDNYVNLVGKNSEALNLMYNPKTGYRNLVSSMVNVPFGVASRPIVNMLGSEKVREKLVNKMLEKEKEGARNNIGELMTAYGINKITE